MTKEELEKEAIAKYKIGSYPQLHPDHYAFIHGYLAGAEPREKRIADLEQKLEQTEKDLTDYQFNYPKIKDLEKENEELKEKNKWYSEQVCNKECAEVWGQLTKAKEIIKFLINPQLLDKPEYYEWRLKAEQFLKEK